MNTWSCAKCGTLAAGDQNFCKACGTPRGPRRPAPITEPVPVIRRDTREPAGVTPMSRARLALIALLFVVVGGLCAVILNDLRGAEPANPDVPSSSSTLSPSTTTG